MKIPIERREGFEPHFLPTEPVSRANVSTQLWDAAHEICDQWNDWPGEYDGASVSAFDAQLKVIERAVAFLRNQVKEDLYQSVLAGQR